MVKKAMPPKNMPPKNMPPWMKNEADKMMGKKKTTKAKKPKY